MSEVLEAFERIKRYVKEACNPFDYPDNKPHLDTIEKELKELEERREMMKRFNEACVPMILDNETEKKLKALEIIKDKRVCVWAIVMARNVDEYNFSIVNDIAKPLTQEQYDLLKEVLNYGK